MSRSTFPQKRAEEQHNRNHKRNNTFTNAQYNKNNVTNEANPSTGGFPAPTSAWNLLSRQRSRKQLCLLQPPPISRTMNNPYCASQYQNAPNDTTKSLPLAPGISELSGEAGTGKTQICLALCVSCVSTPITATSTDRTTTIRNPYAKKNITAPAPERNNNKASSEHPTATSTVLYISLGTDSTKSSAYTKRLQQITTARNLDTQAILSSIFLRSIPNEEELEVFLQENLESYNLNRLRLLVFDSLATLFRLPDSTDTPTLSSKEYYRRRSDTLFHIASRLKRWSDKFHLHILIVNQASMVIPSLGLSWSNCVNTRFYLTREEQEVYNAHADVSSIKFTRYAHVFLSPVLPPMQIRFLIKDSGCHIWAS